MAHATRSLLLFSGDTLSYGSFAFAVAGELGRSPRSWTDRTVGSPSPPSILSTSAPAMHYVGSPSTDEGIDIEDVVCQVDEVSPKKRKVRDAYCI